MHTFLDKFPDESAGPGVVGEASFDEYGIPRIESLSHRLMRIGITEVCPPRRATTEAREFGFTESEA